MIDDVARERLLREVGGVELAEEAAERDDAELLGIQLLGNHLHTAHPNTTSLLSYTKHQSLQLSYTQRSHCYPTQNTSHYCPTHSALSAADLHAAYHFCTIRSTSITSVFTISH